MSIIINIQKAKAITHDIRRHARLEEFEPYDAVIAKQIPGNDASYAEQERQKIREKYAAIQLQIDNSQTAQELKIIIDAIKV